LNEIKAEILSAFAAEQENKGRKAELVRKRRKNRSAA
jgi:hypothetical protein